MYDESGLGSIGTLHDRLEVPHTIFLKTSVFTVQTPDLSR